MTAVKKAEMDSGSSWMVGCSSVLDVLLGHCAFGQGWLIWKAVTLADGIVIGRCHRAGLYEARSDPRRTAQCNVSRRGIGTDGIALEMLLN